MTSIDAGHIEGRSRGRESAALNLPDFKTGASEDWLHYFILYLPLISVTVLGKLAFTIGSSEILIAQPVVMGVTLLGALTGRLKLVPGRTAFYLAMIAIFTVFQLIHPDFSLSSLVLLALMFMPLAFQLNPPLQDANAHLRRILKLATIIATLGILQYFGQFIIGADYAFPIEHFLPKSIVSQTMNSLRSQGYKSSIYGSNGFFMAEPANFSQFMAIAITLELATFKSRLRLAAFLLGFIVAFSGTGIIILIVTIPTLIILRRRFDILVYVFLGGCFLIGAADAIGLGRFVERASEFSDPHSSAFARFAGQFYFFVQFLSPSPEYWLFGLGAGVMHHAGDGIPHMAMPLPIYRTSVAGLLKIFAEYGFLGAFFFYSFFVYSVMTAKQHLVLRLSLLPMPLLIGATDAGPVALIVSLLLWSPAPRSLLESVSDRLRHGSNKGNSLTSAGESPEVQPLQSST